MDKNMCVFVGKMSNFYKEDVAQNGTHYLWFILDVEQKANATSTDNNYHQSINIMCFKPKVISYLKKVQLRQGNTLVIFGFVSSFRHEINGKTITTNGVNANEIYVVKTKA
jgi:hypothetical protein